MCDVATRPGTALMPASAPTLPAPAAGPVPAPLPAPAPGPGMPPPSLTSTHTAAFEARQPAALKKARPSDVSFDVSSWFPSNSSFLISPPPPPQSLPRGLASGRYEVGSKVGVRCSDTRTWLPAKVVAVEDAGGLGSYTYNVRFDEVSEQLHNNPFGLRHEELRPLMGQARWDMFGMEGGGVLV